MSIDENKVENEIVEGVEEEQLQTEEVSEELVENENLDEEAEAETEEVTEMGHKKGEEEEEHEDEEEEHESKVKEIAVPKTKAGVIQAAVEMLKKARKEDAQKLFAKMTKMDEAEDDGSVKKAIDKVKPEGDKSIKAKPSDAKAKIESVDFEEDLDALVSEEATLSDEFRGKAGAIFEAVLTSKLTSEVERLESEYAQNLEEEVTEIQNGLVEKVDSYLNYVVENWMKENELAVTEGLRTEIAEEFMSSLQTVFKEHYIEVPEGKDDLVEDLHSQVSELEEQLNKSTEDSINLFNKVQSYERAEVVREASSGLAETEAEKLASLVEDIEFDNKENFEMKVVTVKESYFKKEVNESVDEVDSLLGEDNQEVDLSDSMARYTQAITKFNK
jgi:hypothetical protein|tara:strand:- start:297 stop:1460 length:1164 start_codon:yes stop_codon:yes gene_type:complete